MIKKMDEWKWSSYQAMIDEVPARHWLETDWILGNFSKRRKLVISKYIDFVREGIGLPSHWNNCNIRYFWEQKNLLIISKASLAKKHR